MDCWAGKGVGFEEGDFVVWWWRDGAVGEGVLMLGPLQDVGHLMEKAELRFSV
jgi:hypothetical protein